MVKFTALWIGVVLASTQACLAEALFASPTEYQQLKTLKRVGTPQAAIYRANSYLVTHPNDADVRFLLGKMYFDTKAYSQAYRVLSAVLRDTPNYVDARLILINIELIHEHYQKALNLVNAGLKLRGQNPELLQKRSVILRAIRVQRDELLPEHPVLAKHYLNQMGIYQQQYYISDKHQVWDYSTLFYGRDTPVGPIFGKMTYANRLSFQAVQGEIEAYPKINDHVYLDLDFAFANQPNLFPNTAYGAEAYLSRVLWLDFSFGLKYDNIDARHQLAIFSGSFSKEHQKYRVLFRPYYYVPSSGHDSTLYTADFRRIVTDPYFYFGCVLGMGSSPDLANLETVDFIVLHNKLINPYINVPFFHERLIVNLGALAQYQTFPNGLIRNWMGGTIGLIWKY